jgi:hypothetical protein
MNEKLKHFPSENTFNMDELAFNYGAFPTTTMAFAAEGAVSGHKLDKRRFTAVAATSEDGEKLPLWVIGKAAKPHSFRKGSSVEVCYPGCFLGLTRIRRN